MDCPIVSSRALARILDEQRLSKLSVVAFCAQKSISVPSFYQWRKKIAAATSFPNKATSGSGTCHSRSAASNRAVHSDHDSEWLLHWLQHRD